MKLLTNFEVAFTNLPSIAVDRKENITTSAKGEFYAQCEDASNILSEIPNFDSLSLRRKKQAVLRKLESAGVIQL